jgi:hypothetical protein
VEPRATEPEAFPPPSLTHRASASGEPDVEARTGRRYLIADVDPLDVTGIRTVIVGTALFVVALLALLPFTDELRENGTLWWLWTCGAGIVLGLFGIHYCRRRAAAIAARSREAGTTEPGEPGRQAQV